MHARFGEFVLDTDRRELTRGPERVHLRPQALELLRLLIESRPKAVSHEQLYDALWPATFVDKTNLHKVVHRLRDALDDRDQTIIRTAYGFGFSFAAPVVIDDESVRSTRWQIVIGDREYDLREGENIIGRERDAVVRLDAPSISRRHARIIIGPQNTLEDLGSKNGTCLHGKRIRVARLADGDAILIGTIAASFRVIPGERSTETVR